MRIIAYTYEADFHCVKCAAARFAVKHPAAIAERREHLDEHDLPFAATDREGNTIQPVFSTDELPCDFPAKAGGYSPVVCGDCHAVIKESQSIQKP